MMRPIWPIPASLLAIALLAAGASAAEPTKPADAEAVKFFETKVRPVLVARCYECHGPDSKPEGKLRLDSLAGMLAGGDIGPAIKPGDAKGSLLVDAINHGDVVQMPPKNKLPVQEVADLTAWVAQGAPWPDAPAPVNRPAEGGTPFAISEADRAFWAFRPPVDPPLPAVKNEAWVTSPVDRFVLAGLESHDLQPAPPADRRTLIRRLTFDLHGLPPTREEVDQFLADTSTDALAKVVDRLLASPRYGERWGRHWLDIARYADSNGMDENMAMASAWRYRDYVIGAFNKDLPYDQFVREQLAGDLLDSADPQTRYDRLTATGFLVLGPKMLAEDDPVKMEMDIIDEQVDTVGRAFMGLTLGCARCHDHKFDPIPTADYYALAGIFKSTKSMQNYRVVAMWSERALASDDEVARLKDHEKRLVMVSDSIASMEKRANETLLSEARARVGDYLLAATERLEQQQHLTALTAELAAGKLGDGAIVIEAEHFVRGNVLRDTATYGAGIGVLVNAGQLPNVAEYEFDLPAAGTYQLALRYTAAEARPVELTLDGRKLGASAAGKVTGSWQPDTQTWSIEAVVPLASGKHVVRLERNGAFPHIDKVALLPARFAKDSAGTLRLVGGLPADRGLNPAFLDQWTDYLTRTKDDPQSVLRAWHAWRQLDQQASPPQLDETTAESLAIVKAPRPTTLVELATRYSQLCRESADQPAIAPFQALLMDSTGPFALPKSPERFYAAEAMTALTKLRDERTQLQTTLPNLPHALAVDERQPENLKVHIRGSHLTLGAEAPRQFPRILAGDMQPPIGRAVSGRLELARWLTRSDHPLTSRVMVNRIWQGYFGDGLVRSPDNFGRLGEQPDNQPLLDWLALRFVESGWSIKAVHRLIVLSSAYQMSTRLDPRAAQIDPENRLVWRMNRRRLEAEEIRDAILATSGQLDDTMGGTLLTNKNHTYVTSTASVNDVKYENNRRSVYLPVVRSAVYDVFQAFDFADPSMMNGKRPSTTVAPQALFMMNSPLVLRQTRAMAEDLLSRADTDDAQRVRQAYLRAYSREPSEAESRRSLDFVARYQSDLAAQNVAATEARTRAWQALCRVIISSNEFVFLE